MDDAISVALRVRPLSASELSRGCQSCIDCIPNEPQVVMRDTGKAFTYNYVFGPESSQAEVYDNAVKNLVPKLFKGYNVTILAYGQTGSGKTHSMGTCYNGKGEMGIIPRAVRDIFEKIAHSHDQDFKVSTSFMELFKEKLFDLMACSTKPRDQCIVDIREDARGVHIPGLVDLEVKSVEETFKSLMMGSAARATGATAMNAQSSRSHAIFTLTIQMCKKNNGGGDMVSKFCLVDLAGSEKSEKTGATGERFKEGVTINRGLSALGKVISALGHEGGHVPYRDHKLTRLLQDSLGGNSITLMVACASPAHYNFEETLSTLRYADRARQIKNKPIINQDPKAAEILRLQKENTELRLQILGSGGKIGTCPKEHEDLADENDTLKAENRKLTEVLNNALSETTNLIERVRLALLARDRMNMKLKELNAQCNMTITKAEENASVPVEGESELKKKYDLLREEIEKLCSIIDIDDIERLKSPNVLKTRRINRSLSESYLEGLEGSDSSFESDNEPYDPDKDHDDRETPLFKRFTQDELLLHRFLMERSTRKKLNLSEAHNFKLHNVKRRIKRRRSETGLDDNSPKLVEPSGSGERKYFPEAKF